MLPSGMVHALERVRQMLRPSGVLLDLHPAGDSPPIEVRVGKETIRVGVLDETDGCVEYGLAEAALAQVIRVGLFAIDRSTEYPFLIHADSLEELRTYLAEEWTDAVIDEAILRRISLLMAEPKGDSGIILRDRILARQLRPI